MDTIRSNTMKIETVAITTIRWGVILPVIGGMLMAAGAAVYAAVMVINLGAAEVDVTTLPLRQ